MLEGDATRAYGLVMNQVALPPDLEQFVADAVANGRYRNRADLIAAGVDLLRHREDARRLFVATLDDAIAAAERDGWHSLDDVLHTMDSVIAQTTPTMV